MASGEERNEPRNRAAAEAAGRNDPLGASEIAPSGQVGLNSAIVLAGEFAQLAIDIELNSRKWRDLAEGFKIALEQMRALVQDVSENFDAMPKVELEQKLRALGLRLAEVLQWRADWAEAEQEAEELSRRRSEEVNRFLDYCSSLRRGKA